jgi:hypothetical protein
MPRPAALLGEKPCQHNVDGDGGVRLASRTAPEDFGGTMLRLLAYMAGLAVLGGLAAIFFRLPAVVAAVGPAPRLQWIEVERPRPAFELSLPELGGPASRYAIFRRDADGAPKDVLSWGEPAGSGPYVMLEVYRPRVPGDRFIDPLSEVAARLIAFTVTDDVKPAGVIDGKFGAVPLVDSPAPLTILRCSLPGGIAAPETRSSTAPCSPARSTGSPFSPPQAIPRWPTCSRAPSSSAASAAGAIRSWRRRPRAEHAAPSRDL